MAEISTNKCPNCGGAIEFNPLEQKMVCPYCDTEFEIKDVQEFNNSENDKVEEKMEWDTYTSDTGSGDWTDEESSKVEGYICNACGGEIIADKDTGASFCPYCGNPVIMPKQFEGMFKPDYVIPFKVTKDKAKQGLKDFLKNKFLLPKEFKSENKIEKISGLYVPYWLFDCDADADMRYRATNVSTWRSGDYRYTKTKYYSIVRSGDVGFMKIPIDGSSKIDNKYTEAIEPFNYEENKNFQTAYLTGFLADKYDVKPEECIPRINQRITESTEQAFRKTIHGYATVSKVSNNINIKKGDIRYAMLPVWILNSKYKDKIYTFAMNGQTGKFVGELPTDIKKMWLTFAGVFAGAFAVAFPIINFFFGR